MDIWVAMKGSVNKQERYAKMRAHTATHLLHAALGEYVNHVKQAGSLVEEDYVRFDFTSDSLLTDDQLKAIAQRVNYWIQQANPVSTKVTSYSDAVATRAKAFFEDKYGDEVRVVSIKNIDGSDLSVELCGGTHVENTAYIGSFVIVEHSSVASGVKRILAYTGIKVADYARSLENRIEKIAKEIKVQPSQVEQKIEKIVKEQVSMSHTIESLQEQQIVSILQQIVSGNDFFDIIVHIDAYTGLKSFDSKIVINKAREFFSGKKVAIYNNEGNFAFIGEGVKLFAKQFGLQGGGSDTLLQGRDKKVASVFGI